MMAAIAATKENPAAKIRILERKDLPGKKILSTGNGRCNFTNQVMNVNCFFSDTPNGIVGSAAAIPGRKKHWMYSLILVFFPRTRNGYYYPRSDQASSIVSVLRTRLQQAGVEVETNVYVTGLKKTKKRISYFRGRKKIRGRCSDSGMWRKGSAGAGLRWKRV